MHFVVVGSMGRMGVEDEEVERRSAARSQTQTTRPARFPTPTNNPAIRFAHTPSRHDSAGGREGGSTRLGLG